MEKKMSNVDQALACFESGFNCSQAIFSTYGPLYGLDRDMCLRIASPFGAGMGYMQETCGAVSGAFMVIGLKYGRISIEDEESKERTYRLVRKFAKRFKSRNKSIQCGELLGVDITTVEGLEEAREKALFKTRCPAFVRDAAEILEEIL